MIFGRPGSGKSTFALQLRNQLSLPLYHLDRWFFIENWVERDKVEFLSLQKDFVDQERWIIDGNAMRSLDMRYRRADVAIFFCYPKITCLFRAVQRLFHKNPDIHDRAEGCREAVRWDFVKYLWTFEKRFTPLIEQLQMQYPKTLFFKITHNQEKNDLEKILKDNLSFIDTLVNKPRESRIKDERR